MILNGDRIRQARGIRCLTQAELARRVGVNQSTIAGVESGRLSPSEELLAAIASETNFPVAFFEQLADDDFPLGTLLLYRARASVRSRQEDQARYYASALFECALRLSSRVTSIPLRLPQIDDTPERAAEITRVALGLSPDRPIGNLIRVVEMAGVVVLGLPLHIEGLAAFSLWARYGTERPAAERPVVVLLAGDVGDRRRFSTAHEIGHLVLHRSMRGDVQVIEKEADFFAGALLLPETAMREELIPPITLTGLAALKRRWRVSMQSIIMRAYDLNIISERQKRYLFQQMGTRGWRKREPAALSVPVEKPRAFRQMVEMIYGVPINYDRLATDVTLPLDLLQDSLSVYVGQDTEPPNVVAFPGVRHNA